MYVFKPSKKIALPARLHFRIDRVNYEHKVDSFESFSIGKGSAYSINAESDEHANKIADRLRSNENYEEL